MIKIYMPDVNAVIFGENGRKYINDKTAKAIASQWSTLGEITLSALYRLAQTGEITDVSKLREEIHNYADNVASVDWHGTACEDLYGALVALDVYVCQWKKSRKPVAIWSTLPVAA